MENQEVQHLQINIPEWLANSNDQIVIICSDGDGTDGQHGNEGDVVTVNSILDGTEQNQVVVQMPAETCQDETPQTTGNIPNPTGEILQTSTEIQQPLDDIPLSQDDKTLLPSGDSNKVPIPMQLRKENLESVLAAIDSSNENQNSNGNSDTAGTTNVVDAEGEETTQQRTVHVTITEADAGIERPCPVALYKRVDNIDEVDEDTSTNYNQPSFTSNLNEHDYLADKNQEPNKGEQPRPVKAPAPPPPVSRRSKRKAAMSPRRWCRAGCCDDGGTHGQSKEVKAVDEGKDCQAPTKKLKALVESEEDPIPAKRSKETKSSSQDKNNEPKSAKNCKEKEATSPSEIKPKPAQKASKRVANTKGERSGLKRSSKKAQEDKNEEIGVNKLDKDNSAVEKIEEKSDNDIKSKVEPKPAKRGSKRVANESPKADTSGQKKTSKDAQAQQKDEESDVNKLDKDNSAEEIIKEKSNNEMPQSKVEPKPAKRGSKRVGNSKSEAETGRQKKTLEEVQVDGNEKTSSEEPDDEIAAAVEIIMEESEDPIPEAENVDPANAEAETEAAATMTDSTKKATTEKSTEKRPVDSYTISPDGIDIDEAVPINIIKATRPDDLSAVDTEQLGFDINSRFECICGQRFTQKRSLIRHFRRKKVRVDGIEESGSEHYSKFPIAIYPNTKAPRKKPVQRHFQCPHCPRILSTKSGMDYHVMSHTGRKPALCSLCGQTFKSKQLLDQHFVVHSDTNELPHKCGECGRTYLTAARLRAHQKTHGERMYQCEHCPHKFVMAKDLKKHSRVHTGEKPFQCEFCEETFHFSQDVKRHLMKSHIDKAQFKCHHCPKNNIFFTQEKYNTHMRIHGNSDFHCEICSQNFPSFTTFRNHQVLHSGKNPFTCRYENCGQEFKNANDRYSHERKNHDTNQMFCPFCNMAFKKQSFYEDHIKRHREADFKCRVDPECQMSFGQPNARLRHEKLHKTGHAHLTPRDEPVKKKVPKLTKPPPPQVVNPNTVYQCGVCWKTYKNYPSLRDHVREHGEEMPYKCRVVGCNMRFKRVYHRRRHEQSHSTDEIINSVLDTQLRANEESIDFSDDEEGSVEDSIVGDQNVGRNEEVGELSAELAAQALTAASTAAANANSQPAEFGETEIAVQFVLH